MSATPEEQRRAVLATEYASLTSVVANWLKCHGVLPPLTPERQQEFRDRLEDLHRMLFG